LDAQGTDGGEGVQIRCGTAVRLALEQTD
jgi:hypothetical protein